MGLFDRFRKPKTLDKDGKPLPIVVMEEKDTVYAPVQGEVATLEAAELTGPLTETDAGMVVTPKAGALWAPQTGDVTFNVERGELSIVNYLGVHVLVRLMPSPESGVSAMVPLVADGAHVHVGDPLATFDLAAAPEGKAAVVVLVTNADDFAGVQPATDEPVEVGDDLLRVLRK